MVKNSRPSGLPGGVLRVVLIDDSTSGDVLVGALRQSGREVLVERADHEDSLVSLLRGFWPDVVFTTSHAHLGLPAVLAAVRTVRPTVPVIMMAAPGDEHLTASWIRAGVEEVVRRDAAGQTAEAVQRAHGEPARVDVGAFLEERLDLVVDRQVPGEALVAH